MNYVQSKTMGIVSIRLPSEAVFLVELKTTYIFGIPQTVRASGLAMDVKRDLNIIKALDGDNNKKVQFMLASGMNSSALEHSVPEQLFSTPDEPAEGISAVKALKIANDEGIPIYTINQANIDSILPNLQVDVGTITDIKNAVNAGKVVTVSKTNITYNGWTGVGYIIIDPNTGAGAYMVSGGLSGSWTILNVLILTVLMVVATVGVSIALVGLITIIATYITSLTAFIVALQLFTPYIWLLMAIAIECYSLILPPSPPDTTLLICSIILILLRGLK